MRTLNRLLGVSAVLSLSFFSVALFPGVAWGGCTGSSPRWASTADYVSVSACAAQASAGDTIVVTGDASWASTLKLTRGVNLIGSGNPTITGRCQLIMWVTDAAARSAHDTLTIQGFTFDANDATFLEMSQRGIVTLYSSTGGYVRAIIRNNTFKNAPGSKLVG